MQKLAIAALLGLCACAAQAQQELRAGLTLRAGFGGRAGQEWAPHLLASFGSGPQFLQSRSAESQCLMTAGDLRVSGAMASSSACNAVPLVQLDLADGGLSSANLLGLNLMKTPAVLNNYHRDLLSGSSDWVEWTLKQHALESEPAGTATPATATAAR